MIWKNLKAGTRFMIGERFQAVLLLCDRLRAKYCPAKLFTRGASMIMAIMLGNAIRANDKSINATTDPSGIIAATIIITR